MTASTTSPDLRQLPELERDRPVGDALARWLEALPDPAGGDALVSLDPAPAGALALTSSAVAAADELARGRTVLIEPAAAPDPIHRIPAPTGTEAAAAAADGATPAKAARPRRGDRRRVRRDVLTADLGDADLDAALAALPAPPAGGPGRLHLAAGALTWLAADGGTRRSPLLLVPVVRTGPDGRSLAAGTGEPAVNPVLGALLRPAGITLPEVATFGRGTLATLLDDVAAAVAEHHGWRVDDALALVDVSLDAVAVRHDLAEADARLRTHPVVQALAGTLDLGFEPLDADTVDDTAPAGAAPTVLDADAHQRVCVHAATGGHSFVIDGPPGTGKSQTVANVAAALMHAGRSVLFVSAKDAALEVVHRRLTAAGLGAHLLDLRPGRADAHRVATTLAAALRHLPVDGPPTHAGPGAGADAGADAGPDAGDEVLAALTGRLNAHARAIGQRRPGPAMTLHRALGRLAELHDVPAAPGPVRTDGLTPGSVPAVREAAAHLATSAHLERDGSNVWRGLADGDGLDEVLQRATAARARMHGAATASAGVGQAFAALPPQALADLLHAWEERPATIEPSWLRAENLDDARQAVQTLADALERRREADADAGREAGGPWSRLPAADVDTLVPAADLPPGGPAPIDLEPLTAERSTALADTFLSDAGMLDRRRHSLTVIAAILGLPVPRTLPEAGYLLFVASMAGLRHRPERGWFSVAGAERARVAADVLRGAILDLDMAEKAAGAVYQDLVLWLDLTGPAIRFEQGNRALRRLGPTYREDRARIEAVIRPGVSLQQGQESLPLALRWQACHEHFAQCEIEHSGALGGYYTGRSTDFTLIRRVLGDLGRILHPGVDLSAAARVLAADAVPPESLLPTAAHTRAELEAWRTSLGPPPAAPTTFATRPLADAAQWLRAQVEPARAAARLAATVSAAVGRPVTTAQARHLVRVRADVDAAHERFDQAVATLSGVLGALWAGDGTRVDDLRAVLDWTDRVRALAGAPDGLTPAQVTALTATDGGSGLRVAVEAWAGARAELLARFDPERREGLAAELDDEHVADSLLTMLIADRQGRDDWLAHTAHRRVLLAAGLGPLLEHCAEADLDPPTLADVAERALLRAWADELTAADPALAAGAPGAADERLARFRSRDRAVVAGAAARVRGALGGRRPPSGSWDDERVAGVRREARAERPAPVREQLEAAGELLTALAPCVLATPAQVARHLPAGARFDVVVVDEAGRLPVAAALGAVGRGDALIVAGDQQQLPPEGGRESLLEVAQRAGTLRSLPLPTHYRSRHDALVAFSNEFFYGGMLTTFPGVREARAGGPAVFRTEPGTTEADLVALRVAEHVAARPDRSLGVVALDPAQVPAIEAAVADLRRARPEVDAWFDARSDDDPLAGFFVRTADDAQGDERDVVVLAVGYGPDAGGTLPRHFAPLDSPDAWRRLNVAVTRARHRTEVVCAVGVGDFPAGAGEGLLYLRHYLEVARLGPVVLLDPGAPRPPEEPLARSVRALLESWGHTVTPQLGSPTPAGHRVDLAVHDPEHPDRYLLGVLCDGEGYGSLTAARDRDRLHDEVLTGLGWRLHRVWATAWHADREAEEQRLRDALRQALERPDRGLADGGPADGPAGVSTPPAAGAPGWAVPYRTAVLDPLPGGLEPTDEAARTHLVEALRTIAAVEAPVHLTVVLQRLREAWSPGRLSARPAARLAARLRTVVEAAIAADPELRLEGGFVVGPATGPVAGPARLPVPACQRRPEHVADAEIAAAMAALLLDAREMGDAGSAGDAGPAGVTPLDVYPALTRLFGWSRRTPEITARFDAVAATLPVATQPVATQPAATQPAATQPAGSVGSAL